MSDLVRKKSRTRKKNTKLWFGLLVVMVWSLTLGWGMAVAISPANKIESVNTKSVDSVPSRFQLGEQLYLDNCSTCHIALPPAIFPTETWRQLLQEMDTHYGQKLPSIISPVILLMWEYFKFTSRPINQDETIPYRVDESRYFKALHPKVELPQTLSHRTCITCHPGVNQFDYRTLTPEWEDAP